MSTTSFVSAAIKAALLIFAVSQTGCDSDQRAKTEALEAKVRELQADVAAMKSQFRGASEKQEYDMQERCSKRAEQVLKSWSEDRSGSTAIASYESHYSVRLNKCFARLHSRSATKNGLMTSLSLLDVNSGTEYGTYLANDKQGAKTIISCQWGQKVLDRKLCETEDAWMALTEPIMNN